MKVLTTKPEKLISILIRKERTDSCKVPSLAHAKRMHMEGREVGRDGRREGGKKRKETMYAVRSLYTLNKQLLPLSYRPSLGWDEPLGQKGQSPWTAERWLPGPESVNKAGSIPHLDGTHAYH